jgi:hypothetical protein
LRSAIDSFQDDTTLLIVLKVHGSETGNLCIRHRKGGTRSGGSHKPGIVARLENVFQRMPKT